MNCKKVLILAVVALPMMIMWSVTVGAQTVHDFPNNVCGQVVGRVITVVKGSGESLQSNDGGRNWNALNVESTQDIVSSFQRILARRPHSAQASATGATVGPNPTIGITTVDYELTQSGGVLFKVQGACSPEVQCQEEVSRQAGANSTAINTTELSKGVYYYRIMFNGETVTCDKVMIIR